MKKLRCIAFFLCLSLFAGISCFAADAQQAVGEPELASAESALLGDMGSGRVLFSMNAYSRREPASLTKIMTLLLAVEAIEDGSVSESDMVKAGADCKTGIENDSSTAGINMGEVMSLKDLLHCAALISANEACNIIASHVSGSLDAFVESMNRRAEELGCSGTHFTNTHGMPDSEHYTTARDLFLISCEAMKHPLFAELVSCTEYTTAETNDHAARELKSSNALICGNSVYTDKYLYDGAVGIKTGHTENAGYCLVGAVQKNGVNVISIILGADADRENREFDSFADSVRLLDWCFENFSYRSIVKAGSAEAKQPVCINGKTGELALLCGGDINALAANGLDVTALEKTVKLDAQSLTQLPEEGAQLGTVSFSDPDDGTVYGTVPLVAGSEVVYDEPEAAPEPDADRKAQQKTAVLIVCALAALTVLVLVLILSSRRHRTAAGKARRR